MAPCGIHNEQQNKSADFWHVLALTVVLRLLQCHHPKPAPQCTTALWPKPARSGSAPVPGALKGCNFSSKRHSVRNKTTRHEPTHPSDMPVILASFKGLPSSPGGDILNPPLQARFSEWQSLVANRPAGLIRDVHHETLRNELKASRWHLGNARASPCPAQLLGPCPTKLMGVHSASGSKPGPPKLPQMSNSPSMPIERGENDG